VILVIFEGRFLILSIMKFIFLSLFITVILDHELNFGYYIRKLFGIRISKPIKFLDCFPCLSFWVSVIVTAVTNCDLFVPIYTFLISKIYDLIKN
jgi:hypothetical protein